jgi:hypothetical protein
MKDSEKYWESTCETIPEETRDILNEYLLSETCQLSGSYDFEILEYIGIVFKRVFDSNRPTQMRRCIKLDQPVF